MHNSFLKRLVVRKTGRKEKAKGFSLRKRGRFIKTVGNV